MIFLSSPLRQMFGYLFYRTNYTKTANIAGLNGWKRSQRKIIRIVMFVTIFRIYFVSFCEFMLITEKISNSMSHMRQVCLCVFLLNRFLIDFFYFQFVVFYVFLDFTNSLWVFSFLYISPSPFLILWLTLSLFLKIYFHMIVMLIAHFLLNNLLNKFHWSIIQMSFLIGKFWSIDKVAQLIKRITLKLFPIYSFR